MIIVTILDGEVAELKKGQRWYIKLPGSTCVSEKIIVDFSNATVLLDDIDSYSTHTKLRYAISEITWVEKIS
jgi:hypothetical protein